MKSQNNIVLIIIASVIVVVAVFVFVPKQYALPLLIVSPIPPIP